MPSAIDICNLALSRITQGQPITSLTGLSKESKACGLLYPIARDACLESAAWQFATGRESLAQLNLTISAWEHVYALPADCLAARYIPTPEFRQPAPQARVEFALEQSAAGNVVLVTDEAAAELVYTRKVENPLLFTPLFVDALGYKLASDLAMALPGKAALSAGHLKTFQLMIAVAAAKDLNKSQTTQKPLASYIRARNGRSGV